VKHDIWEREKDLENTKEAVAEFERRISIEVRRQKRLDMVEERNFKREELLGKYTVKILYRWDNRKFENKYLKKLEKTSENRSQFLQRKNLKERIMLKLKIIDFIYFHFISYFYFYFYLFFYFWTWDWELI